MEAKKAEEIYLGRSQRNEDSKFEKDEPVNYQLPLSK
jgi:hypothetical protein